MTGTPIYLEGGPMTATTTPVQTASTTNPHRVATLITGWAVPIIFVAALWGAGHNPDDAAWSAFAIVAIVAVYLYNKARSIAWDRRHGGGK